MTTNCDLFGRGTAQKALTPTWYPHTVCDRANCRAAARDAVESTYQLRERHGELVRSIRERLEVQMMPLGWRDDAMAKKDVVDNEEWWANSIIKEV